MSAVRFDLARFEGTLKHPIVDKTAGIVGILPFAIPLYAFWVSFSAGAADVYKIGIALNLLILLGMTVFRRAPSRFDLTPLALFVTAGRTYWSVLLFLYVDSNTSARLVPEYASLASWYVAIAVVAAGRLSLGRSIGLIPAHRGLVTGGAYRFVRHPIHIGSILYLVSYLLSSFSLTTLTLVIVGCVFIVSKTFVEERLLQEDPAYRSYCKQVRWRYIPGVV